MTEEILPILVHYDKPSTMLKTYKFVGFKISNMDYICDTRDYNVAEFQDHYQNNLPQLVKVVQGYCGDIADDIFDREQVMSIQCISRQQRVVCKFKTVSQREQLFSIPSIYTEKLCVVGKNGKVGKEQTLTQILQASHLPLTVRFPKDRVITVGNSSVNTNHIPNIEMLQQFDEVYLLGNFVNDGEICTDVVSVPLYLTELRFAAITGIKGRTDEEWEAYLKEIERITSYVEYDMQFGNPNIAEYDPNAIHSDATYSYVAPRLYSNIVSLMQQPVVRELPKDESPVNTVINQDYGGEYEEIANATRSDKTPAGVFKELQSKFNTKSPMANAKTPSPKASPQQETSKVPPFVPKKPAHILSSANQKDPPALPARRAKFPLPTPQSQQSQDDTSNESHNYSNDVPRTKIQPTVQEKVQNLNNNTSSALPKTTFNTKKSVPPTTETVKPLQQSTSRQNDEPVPVPDVNNKDDVASLTINELITYLGKLGLDKYVDTFRSEKIDGALLVEMDKDIFRGEFGMSLIEAMKLSKFVKEGHVPV